MILGLLGQILLTYSISKEEYGSWVIIIDILGIIFLLVQFGIPDVIGRDVPRKDGDARGLVRFYSNYQIIAAILICPIAMIISTNIQTPGIGSGTILILVIAITAQILGMTYRMVLRSLGEARIESWLKILDRIIVILGYSVNYFFLESGIEGFALATAIGPSLTLVIAFHKARLSLGPLDDEEKTETSQKRQKKLLSRAVPFVLTAGLLVVINRLDKVVLLHFTGTEAVAVFNVGWLCYFAGCAVPQAFKSILLPEFGTMRNDSNLVNKTILSSYRILEWFIPPGIVVGTIVALFLIPSVFPHEYSEFDSELGGSAISVFFVLLSSWTMITLAGPFFANIQAGKRPWLFTTMGVLMIFTDLLFAVILVPRFGVTGAAWSTVITRAVSLIFLFIASSGHIHFKDIGYRISFFSVASLFLSMMFSMQSSGRIGDEMILLGLGVFVSISIIIGWRPKFLIDQFGKNTNGIVAD